MIETQRYTRQYTLRMSAAIENQKKLVNELTSKYTDMKEELDDLESKKESACKELFLAYFANVQAAENKEDAALKFLKYILTDLNETLNMWEPVEKPIYELSLMCKDLVNSSTSSRELVIAADRVLNRIEKRQTLAITWSQKRYDVEKLLCV